MTNATEKAYRERNRLMVLAAALAMDVGHRAGRYRDPEATEERFAWVVQIELQKGEQVTMHVDADDVGSGFELLPVIERDWDGHDAGEAFARVAEFVASKLSEINDGFSLRERLVAAVRRASAVEHGALMHIQVATAELEQERRESARLRGELRVAIERLAQAGLSDV